MKLFAQVSGYWPIPRLASISEDDVKLIIWRLSPNDLIILGSISRRHDLTLFPPSKKGCILLVGSGPGHPSLLTIATHNPLTKYVDLVLLDKLVPPALLALIPETVEVRIARKFPGNVEGAQSEMMDAAVEAARRGLTVARVRPILHLLHTQTTTHTAKTRRPSRLRPYRGRSALLSSTRVRIARCPGVSSALAAPIFAGIPVTQRGVAESVVVCTSVGRRGKEVELPGYERSRTVLVLVGVARIAQVAGAIIRNNISSGEGLQSGEGRREGRP
jgi:uroporphyrin-III C-methyltransferase